MTEKWAHAGRLIGAWVVATLPWVGLARAADVPVARDLTEAAARVVEQFQAQVGDTWDKATKPVTFGVIQNSDKLICKMTNTLGPRMEAALLRQHYRVVERTHKKWLENELAEQSKMFYDPSTGVKLGKRLGASALVLGTVSWKPGQNTVALNVWLTDLEKGEKIATAEVMLWNVPAIQAECEPIAGQTARPEPPKSVRIPKPAPPKPPAARRPAASGRARLIEPPYVYGVGAFGLVVLLLIIHAMTRPRPASSAAAIPETHPQHTMQAEEVLDGEEEGVGAEPGKEAGMTIEGRPDDLLSRDTLGALASIRNPHPGFQARVWVDRAAEAARTRDIRVMPAFSRAAYRLGEEIRLSFQSERDAYLWVLDIGTSGKITVLFPNAWHQDNAIQGDRAYTIPGPEYGFKWLIEPPTGIETIKAIFTSEPIDLLAMDFREGEPFVTLSKGMPTRDIKVVATEMADKTQRLPASRWAESTCEFTVTDP